ncbi:DNA replication/repair protein RecF [Xanthobacter dioxanivorans]|uniref:DNA replication and repair protein RecF n=1 Tax=Xanthobacter dioxanivorans TaxID=2528964 RepID=A0A974PS42_9HYPH|nr:DNA replication/repair protein RecF [Xanthobacter dioxanivorans]QRG08283.1 DNA replication/repair protein RecF [Xanthobacter dioxanivorans]
MPRAAIVKLTLTGFRSYAAAQLGAGDGPVVLTGPNGAGKTNILEALSFLSPGRGLRRAQLGDVGRRASDPTGETGPGAAWAVSALVDGALGEARLGTGFDPAQDGGQRRCRIDGEPVPSANAFLDHLKVLWLTPEMDGLFLGPPGDRRRYLDRLVLAVDGAHGTRVNGLERALRSRNRLLEENGSARFLDAVEHEVAELAVAVAAARLETVGRLGAEIAAHRDEASPFPFAELALDGEVERLIAACPALEVEDRYRAVLREGRPRDKAAGRTLAGPHLTDLAVSHGEKRLPAARCSTGEQKSLLIGLTLSHARLVAAMQGLSPVLLLDDVAAYLDAARRAGLFDALRRLGAQVWMTGADPSAFAALDGAERFDVTPGRVARA